MDAPTSVLDIIRVVVLLVGAQAVAVALVVASIYARGWLLSRRGPKVPWIGLLPMHVTLVAISYLIMVGGTMSQIIGRLHNPHMDWHTPVFAVGYVTGAIAMWIILGHSRHRLRSIIEALGDES